MLEEFFEDVSRILIPGQPWGHNLDAFNDILRGGFGMPSGDFTINWKNHELSKEPVGYNETVRQLEFRLSRLKLHWRRPSGRSRKLRSTHKRGELFPPNVFGCLWDGTGLHNQSESPTYLERGRAYETQWPQGYR